MPSKMNAGEQNLHLLNTVLPYDERFYIWCYDNDGKLIGTSCPDEEVQTLDYIFRYFDGPLKMRKYLKGNNDIPFIIGSEASAVWGVVPNYTRSENFNIIIGPVFFSRVEKNQLHLQLFSDSHKKKESSHLLRFLEIYDHLPVITFAVFSRYAIIAHNMLNETKLTPADLTFEGETFTESTNPVTKRDRSKVYQAEKALLQTVRDGDLNYKSILQNSASLSGGVQVHGRDPLRQAKTSVIVFISLVCRPPWKAGFLRKLPMR